MVSADYMKKISRAVRIQHDADFDEELRDIVLECREDLVQLGVTPEKASDESDRIVLGAVRSFVRWKFPIDEKSAELNRGDYMLQRDELRRRSDYVGK